MKRAFLYAALWMVAFSALAATRIIPVAGHAPGANNTVWATDVTLKNNTMAAITADLIFHADNGVAHTRSVSLAAGASILLEDAVAPSPCRMTPPRSTIRSSAGRRAQTPRSGRRRHRSPRPPASPGA